MIVIIGRISFAVTAVYPVSLYGAIVTDDLKNEEYSYLRLHVNLFKPSTPYLSALISGSISGLGTCICR